MVRAETQNVPRIVWPIVGTTERTDMRALRVRSCRGLQAFSAHLTPVLVHLLDTLGCCRVANDSLNGAGAAGCRLGGERRRRLLFQGGEGEMDQTETPNLVARAADL